MEGLKISHRSIAGMIYGLLKYRVPSTLSTPTLILNRTPEHFCLHPQPTWSRRSYEQTRPFSSSVSPTLSPIQLTMKVYYHDNQPVGPWACVQHFKPDNVWQGESHLSHHSGTEISVSSLSDLGILYYSFPPSSPESASLVEDVATSRGYTNRDEISSSKLIASIDPTSYEQILKTFFNEHMHEDEEIRYILKGSGYFDVRDADDKWVRVKAETGDFLVLPAGIYHRFTLDESRVGTEYLHWGKGTD